MKWLSVQLQPAENAEYLPNRIRYLCLLVCFLLVGSALVELWIMQTGWFRGEAFQRIYEGYLEYYPELAKYPVGGTKMYLATLLLDYLSFVPYYAALLLAAVIFYRFGAQILWDRVNIMLLKVMSFLLIFDACFPNLKDTLQVLTFTSARKPLKLVVTVGISAEGVRTCIIGLAIYAFSMILSNAKKLADDNKLIV